MKVIKRHKLVILCLSVLCAPIAIYYFLVPKYVPQNENDVAILKRTIELLDDENQWSKDDDRLCSENERELTLFCALERASIEVTGQYVHRAASLQEVRYEIDKRETDNNYPHRLRDFNNDPNVSFSELHDMLQDSLRNLERYWAELN